MVREINSFFGFFIDIFGGLQIRGYFRESRIKNKRWIPFVTVIMLPKIMKDGRTKRSKDFDNMIEQLVSEQLFLKNRW